MKTPENIGKMLIIDIETGDYEVGDRNGMEATGHLLTKHEGAILYALRIGYVTSVSFGGFIEREATTATVLSAIE